MKISNYVHVTRNFVEENYDYLGAVNKLQEKYSDRNLTWYQVGGCYPFHGNGEMDGMLVTFQFWRDSILLELGVIDAEFRRAVERNSDVQARRGIKAALAAVEAGEPYANVHLAYSKLTLGKRIWNNSLPDRKLFSASSGLITGNKFAGSLTPEEFYASFVEMVEKLKPVAEENQLAYPNDTLDEEDMLDGE